jgi:hypothetical protein
MPKPGINSITVTEIFVRDFSFRSEFNGITSFLVHLESITEEIMKRYEVLGGTFMDKILGGEIVLK